MILRSCVQCEFHQLQEGEKGPESHCGKENCWSKYSRCLIHRAVDRFLDQDRVDAPVSFSALAHVYSSEE